MDEETKAALDAGIRAVVGELESEAAKLNGAMRARPAEAPGTYHRGLAELDEPIRTCEERLIDLHLRLGVAETPEAIAERISAEITRRLGSVAQGLANTFRGAVRAAALGSAMHFVNRLEMRRSAIADRVRVAQALISRDREVIEGPRRGLVRSPLVEATMNSVGDEVVFISYPRGDAQLDQLVLELTQRLRREGVDARIDQFEANPPQGWLKWMDDHLRVGRFIICVCTPRYRRRFEGEEQGPSGVAWEGQGILRRLYEEGGHKLVPVLFDGYGSVEDIPHRLRGQTRYHLPKDYDDLYFFLTNQQGATPAPLGPRRERPPVAPQSGRPPAPEGLQPRLIETAGLPALPFGLFDKSPFGGSRAVLLGVALQPLAANPHLVHPWEEQAIEGLREALRGVGAAPDFAKPDGVPYLRGENCIGQLSFSALAYEVQRFVDGKPDAPAKRIHVAQIQMEVERMIRQLASVVSTLQPNIVVAVKARLWTLPVPPASVEDTLVELIPSDTTVIAWYEGFRQRQLPLDGLLLGEPASIADWKSNDSLRSETARRFCSQIPHFCHPVRRQ